MLVRREMMMPSRFDDVEGGGRLGSAQSGQDSPCLLPFRSIVAFSPVKGGTTLSHTSCLWWFWCQSRVGYSCLLLFR